MTVYLVGAGPGDPGLLTVRGAEVLRRADVVVFDRLSIGSLLELAPAGAERINVGKAPGHPTMPQEQINELLARLAQRPHRDSRQRRRRSAISRSKPSSVGRYHCFPRKSSGR